MTQFHQKFAAALTSAAMLGSFGASLPLQTSAADIGIEDFSKTQITMTDAYSTNAFEKEMDYLLAFDTNRLLAGFRENAGLNTFGAKRYGGWENTKIAGHCVGHYLSAIAQAYENPNVSAADKAELEKRMKLLCDGLLECQKNSKGKPGFVWAAKPNAGTGVETQFDMVEQGKTNIINEAWVPWYTMHKLIQGLVDVYNATGYGNAKTVASGLGDWTYNRAKGWNANTHRTVLSIEYGGMNDCLYELYAITGKDTHAVAAHYFDETNLHEAVLKGGRDVLNNKHANTTIPKFIGALKRYIVLDGKTVNGEKVDASKYLQYAEAFWDMVTTHHTYITGGNSEWEHFGKDDILNAERTNCNCETCNSYNMLKLSRELFKITHDPKYMDYYEQTYYNSILSSQNPETGMTTYFQPMATGYFKVYSDRWEKFWCCTGSGMESFTKLGDTIYMHEGNILYVNMYQSSSLNWADQNVTVVQESEIPVGDKSKFTIDGSGALEFRFRIPDWTAGTMTVDLNGTKYDYKTVDGYAQVKGDFKKGDVITLTIPEEVKAYNLPDDPAVYGFKYGPVVLSAELGKANMQTSSTGMWVTIPKDKVVNSETIKISKQGQSVTSFMSEINDHLVRKAGTMQFTLKDTNTELTFSPHYQQYQQRYGIYWKFVSNGTVIEEKLPRAKTSNSDTVQPGYGQYENDNLHNMIEYKSQGVTDDSTYRYATDGGWFTYTMAVDDTAPMTVLSFKVRKADDGKTLRVRVGDTILFAQALKASANAKDVYDVKLLIPQDVMNRCVYAKNADGKDYKVIDVTFSSNDGDKESARVCDFIYMTAVKPAYEYDSTTAYFVDCGDQNTSTLTGKDKLGLYNCVTEQLYGADEVTGAVWGLIDDATDQYNGSSKGGGIYTANTWCDESHAADGAAKNTSFRYTKNQYENSIDRHLDYAFALPNGSYSVEVAFADPWSCSKNPTVYANLGETDESVIAKNCAIGSAVKGTAKVTNGKLTINVRSEDKAINLCYIIIKPEEVTANVTGQKGDVNLDGKVDVLDAVALQKYLLGQKDFTGENAFAADICSDAVPDIYDLAALKRTLLQ